MLNLLTSEQMRQADTWTIAHKPITSIDLMEDAAKAFVRIFITHYPDRDKHIAVYCGTGNNGGDGLAIARLLSQQDYKHIRVYIARFSNKQSPDFEQNLQRLRSTPVNSCELQSGDFPTEQADIIIDALLGSGLNKPLAGDWLQLVSFINSLHAEKVAVDIPTGFFADGSAPEQSMTLKANRVITFQRPKINFLLPESAVTFDTFEVADIGLDENFIRDLPSPYKLIEEADIRHLLKPRKPFSHKGTYGHALIIAGAEETMGAALLSAEACLKTGAGLTTACIPASGLTALNTRLPEVMAVLRDNNPPALNWEKYQSIAIGPGLGETTSAKSLVETTLRNAQKPIVIDADAINLIAKNYELMSFVPEGSVFTPHVKEFDRLFGNHQSWWERLETGLDRAKTLGCTILLKNRYTIIFTTSGECLFNPTGSPAMATGGMGDVLTGMIASLLAQGYTPQHSAIAAAYIHGLCGEQYKGNVLTASALTDRISTLMAELMDK
ncbi:NAD(P)H-hydrate dehydratase (plasmid) [Pedobacter sp. BS3]|uniref:NAD(P)H-hydrate dehydratase n=1 Tax=Pedobacter sp. BS3 TaxID=2567937 RepID=UPI0011EC3976|nr:NAD(P)H-hydrate dehydratase [Pedobacter sp. BS3]TZF86359.1 NAD(P)H-hydrate dehydratase [Pedobacter sp. BS3]